MEVLGLDARVECVAAADAPDATRQAGAGGGPVTTPAALTRPSAAPESGVSTPSAATPTPSTSNPSTSTAPTPNPSTSTPSTPTPQRPQSVSEPGHPARPASGGPGPAQPEGAGPRLARSGPAHTGATDGAPVRAREPDWSSAPPPATSAPSWATAGEDPIEHTSLRGVSGIAPTTSPAEVVDDPDSISADDEDIETSGEVGQAVVERILGGTVISDDDE